MTATIQIKNLPQDDRTNGWFNTMPVPAPPARVLEGEQTADWLVIGAGYTGLGAARRLAELRPNDRVIILDAGRVGLNSAGRNAGFAIDLPHNVDMADIAKCQRQTKLNRAGLAHLTEVIESHQINCYWSKRGKVHAAAVPHGQKSIAEFAKGLDGLGEPYTLLDAPALRARLGTSLYTFGIHTPGCYLMQPAALVRGLAHALPPSVELYEDSPVIEVSYGQPVRVKTPGGGVSAPKLILATEAFTNAFGFLQGRIFTLFTFASLTRPLTDAEVMALGGEPDWGIIPGTRGGTTLRFTWDRRILIRNSLSYEPQSRYDPARIEGIRAKHTRAFRRRFPMLPDVTFEHTWGGSLCISRNRGISFGELASGVYGSICQNGVGVAKGTISGRMIAELATGQDSELLSDMLTFGPPESLPAQPFMGWGVRARLKFEEWRAGPEM
ncbi:MAG: FAD-binding oxidoreductase [Alphaproteobacteria bacterium]|nr:FAD-binding oxidoreductase [Alphaproteobacteria bacterium]